MQFDESDDEDEIDEIPRNGDFPTTGRHDQLGNTFESDDSPLKDPALVGKKVMMTPDA